MTNNKLALVACLLCLAVAFLIALGALGWNLAAFLIAAAFFWVLSMVI